MRVDAVSQSEVSGDGIHYFGQFITIEVVHRVAVNITDVDGADLVDEKARRGTIDDATELLSVASAAAARLGHDRADRWAVFGPRLVAHTAVENAAEVGDMETAVRLARDIPATGGLPPTWESRYLLSLAQAQAEVGDDDAVVRTLTHARETTPEWVRYHRLARDLTFELVERRGRRRSAELDDLVRHLQLVP